MFVFYNTKNIYYSLLYLFFFIFYLGLTISIIQAELFTGFLWVTEFTIILIVLVLLFYLNIEGNILMINLKKTNFFYIYFIYIFFFFFTFFYFFNENIFIQKRLDWIYFSFLFDDWYESSNNLLMNDFISLTLSYYSLNNIEFILVGYLLLIGSIICVNLNKIQKSSIILNVPNLLNLFNFFNNYLNYSFLRKQTLSNQSNYQSSIRLIKKKQW